MSDGLPGRVVVVGAGLTGLAAAWHLRDDAAVTVLEASPQPGGQIRTIELAGAPLDVGADAVLARQEHGPALLAAAGFGDEDLAVPAEDQVGLWIDGRLRRLPTGTVFGVPTDLRALARSGALGTGALARVVSEPLRPRRAVAGDRSVADLVGERWGRDVVDRLVEPLLGGVYAGDPERLSAAATLPPVWQAAGGRGPLTPALRAHLAARGDDHRPVFVTLRGGLGRLVDRLAGDLGQRLRCGVQVGAVVGDGPVWRVETSVGSFAAEQVVLAVPARVAARLLANSLPEPARELAGIRAASVGVVALAYDRAAARHAPALSGILVPRTQHRLVKAITLASRKWPHHAVRDVFLVRASVGRIDDTRALALDDATLAERVDAEVRWATGIAAPAIAREVVRWPDALPQYELGHLERLDRIRLAVAADAPSLHLGGAAFDGLGLAARARDAAALAAAVRSRLP